MTPRLLLLVPLALLACSPAPPPVTPPAPPPVTSPEPPAAAPAAPPPAADPPSARVVEIAPSRDDTPGVRAKIVFSNPSRAGCRVLGYKLLWGGSSKAITLKDLTLPPGETRERWIKVSPGDGDLAALKPESGRIELQAECAR